MELDNAMAIGAMPYSDQPRPSRFVCPTCECQIPDDADVYRWPKRIGVWLCGDCLKDEINNASPPELAELMGLDIGKAEDER